jgi:hypothetical protein
MKFYKAFLLLTRGKQIALVVCGAHLLAIFSLLGHHLISSRLKPPRPIVVRTITVAKREEITPKQSAPAPKPKPAAPAKKVEPPKPKAAAPATKKEPPPKSKQSSSKPLAKKELPVDEEDLFLKEIAKSLQKFKEEPPKPAQRELSLPSTIQKKAQVNHEELHVDPTYSEFLIAYLENALDLPEFGDVKAKIEIDRFGKLVNLDILESKSVKNAQFLKNELPELNFPTDSTDSNKTFTITFRNI